MNKTRFSKKMSSFILCMVLIVAMALFTTGCNGSTPKDIPSEAGTQADVQTEGSVLGEGSTVQYSIHLHCSGQGRQ